LVSAPEDNFRIGFRFQQNGEITAAGGINPGCFEWDVDGGEAVACFRVPDQPRILIIPFLAAPCNLDS
jgi:hypothetical protein